MFARTGGQTLFEVTEMADLLDEGYGRLNTWALP